MTRNWRSVLATAPIGALLLAGLATTACNCLPADDTHCFFTKGKDFNLTRIPVSTVVRKGARSAAAKAPRVVTEPNTVTFFAPADAPMPNAADLPVPYDLVPPFRVECTVGLCDPAFYPAPTSVFGLSVFDRTDETREFSAECSRVGGMTATASFGTPGPHAFAGAQRVELALEHDGTNLVAYARDHDAGGAWIEVSRAPVAGTGPYLPKLGALNLEPGQMVSCYSLRVRANGAYGPGQATPQHEAVRKLAEALNDLADGADAHDGAAASAAFESAGQRVQEALAALDAPVAGKKGSPASRRARRARKAAKAAGKRVAQAVAYLDTDGALKPEAAMKRVSAAALSIAQAGDAILPDDLRAAIGGLTLKALLRK